MAQLCIVLAAALVVGADADADVYLRQLQESSAVCASDINMDGIVSTDDLLTLLATFGRSPTGCDAGCTGVPASAECESCQDDLSVCYAAVASGTTSLDTCTGNLNLASTRLETAQADFAAATAQHERTTAALQIALQTEHNATVAALQANCDSALDSSLATARDACVETTAALQAELETQHETTISGLEQDCATEAAAAANILQTCTDTLATRTTELQTAQDQMIEAATAHAATTAALEVDLQAEHAATVAALEATLYVNCNNTLIDRLTEAQDACIAARTALEDQLRSEHETTISLMQTDCATEAAAAAASHADIVAGLEAQLAALAAQKDQELAALRAEYEQRLAVLHCPTPIVPFGDVSGDTNYGGAGVTISCHTGYLPTGKPALVRIVRRQERFNINLRCGACCPLQVRANLTARKLGRGVQPCLHAP